jgi:hypothetical protein
MENNLLAIVSFTMTIYKITPVRSAMSVTPHVTIREPLT